MTRVTGLYVLNEPANREIARVASKSGGDDDDDRPYFVG